MNKRQGKYLFWIVQLATVAVFLGRAYQHLYWDIPIRALLWDEAMMSGLVEAFTSLTWEEYTTSIAVDETIESIKRGFGWFYLFCGVVALLATRLPRWAHKILLLGALGLVFLAALYCKSKFYSIGQFFEYTLQFSTPIILYSFCLLYTSPSPRDLSTSRMPSSA